MGKITEVRKRYKDTIDEITKSEQNWLSFLDTASWNFKYDFIDQVLIYTQRPDAKACAEMSVWNEKVHRWINKNADGIFVLSKDENSKYPFRIVFDVTDTHNYKGTEYKLWSVKEEYEQDIIETLNSTFGGEIDEQTLVNSIYVNALNMVEDNIEDYMSSIQNHKSGTGLENHTDDEIKSILIPTIWSSVAYMMMTRSGINAKEKINIQEFSYIKKFNNNQIITILGTAISDIAEMGIREIAKTVVNLQKEEKNKNHTFVNKQEKEYSNNEEKEIGGIENGENRIHESEGLQHTKSSNDTGEITTREIRNDEITLFKNPEESRVHNIIDGQQIEQSFGTSSNRSNEFSTENSTEFGTTGKYEREFEINKSNGMGEKNEQLQVDSRGTSDERIDLQLNLLSEEEQKQNIAEVENTSVFSFSQDDIDNILKKGSGFENGKFRIYKQLTTDVTNKENVEFLKKEYGIGGFSDDTIGWVDYGAKGITLQNSNRDKKYTISWTNVVDRISGLINQDRYLSYYEKDEYNDWLDLNELEKNKKEDIIKNPDYELAKKIYSVVKDYDFNVYAENTDEQNIELIIADLDDESNVNEYINFLKETLEDIDLDDELSVEIKGLIQTLESKLPSYEFINGDIVYIGTEEFEIKAINDKIVAVVDTSFPLLVKEFSREEFEKKVKENPANDKLRTGTKTNKIEIEPQKEEIENNGTLEERLFEFLNEYELYEISLNESREILTDKQKLLDMLNDFNEMIEREDIEEEFKNQLINFITELSALNEKEKTEIQVNQKEELQANIKRKRRNKIEYFDLHPDIPLANRNNYKIQNDDLGVGSKKEKYDNNIQAIKVLKLCEEQNRYATKEEQEILSKYVGWGGIPEAFDSRIDSWNKEYEELKNLLSEKEYKEAKKSTLTAFYTPPIVIRAMYRALQNMGLEKGNILEPSCRCRKFYGNYARYTRTMQNVWN